MRKLYLVIAALFTLLITGCNGHNETSTVASTQSVTTVEFSVLNSDGNAQQSFAKSEVITLQAKVVDENNLIVANKAVTFSASIGTLAIASKLTNSDGIAIVYITNESLALGAGSVSASVDEISSDGVDYEFIDETSSVLSPSLTIVMDLDDVATNQFKANQEAQITTTLTDNNDDAIVGEIITFTADVGSLSAVTALTNSQGIAEVILSGTDESIGAGVLTASYAINDETNISSTVNYQILSADAIIDSDIRLGYFDGNNNFIEGAVELSIADNTISAGGTLGLSVDLVDENGDLIVTPITVTFSSNCVENGSASIDESVLSINGTAHSTFEDIDCAGASGTDDVLQATVSINNITNTASETIAINGEQLGSIEFISAEPTAIVLKGTGGQNQQETSTLTFQVKSQLNNVLAQQEVSFSLNTTVGDITLSRYSGVTNSQGLITTQVASGSVPTAVRVTATASMDIDGEAIIATSQSDLLSINTGLPEQRSMTIAASVFNPEAHRYSGETSDITVWLSDNFNNPVPDGTTVNFTTEGGTIEPSCSTTNGSCTVTWTSSEPRVADHRITILATALGHETFFDTNGNNIFDDSDGAAIVDIPNSANGDHFNIDSGLDNLAAQASGFIDMSEAWRDDDENSAYDDGEVFIDYNEDGAFSSADGVFNGPQCQGANCASNNMTNTHVRKSLRLVMASSLAETILTNGDGATTYNTSLTGVSQALPDVTNGGSQEFIFSFADTAQQTMPLDTNISISLSAGTLEGETNTIVTSNSNAGFSAMNFFVIQELGATPQVAILTMVITTPHGHVTTLTRSINLL